MTQMMLQMNWKHNFTVHQNYEVQAHLSTYSFKIIDPSIVTGFQDIQFLKVQSIFIAAKEAIKELLCFSCYREKHSGTFS